MRNFPESMYPFQPSSENTILNRLQSLPVCSPFLKSMLLIWLRSFLGLLHACFPFIILDSTIFYPFQYCHANFHKSVEFLRWPTSLKYSLHRSIPKTMHKSADLSTLTSIINCCTLVQAEPFGATLSFETN